jgi:hypothetical protein
MNFMSKLVLAVSVLGSPAGLSWASTVYLDVPTSELGSLDAVVTARYRLSARARSIRC